MVSDLFQHIFVGSYPMAFELPRSFKGLHGRPSTMSDSTYKTAYNNSGHRHCVCITSEDGFGGAPQMAIQDDRGVFGQGHADLFLR